MNISVIGVLEDQDILLDVAALALSQLDHAGCDVSVYLEQLEVMEDRICKEERSALLPSEQAMTLAEVLHGEYDFCGDTEGYDAPVNADFIRVLDRRRGLPISLAILYVAMARRAGWVADILNGAGHVLVRVGERNPVVIDPFNGGRQVSQNDFEALYRNHLHDTEPEGEVLLAPMTNREILARLLFNQAFRAEEENDATRAIVVYERITRIAPDTMDAWNHLARLQIATGDTAGARASLLGMSEVAGDRHVRDRIMNTVRTLGRAGPGM